ncbi:glycosyltransferase family 61 protein [Methylobacterium sp. A49B]
MTRKFSRWKEMLVPYRGKSTTHVDRASYNLAYPDVAASGVDAVVHYETWGRFEGRVPSRQAVIYDIITELYIKPFKRSLLLQGGMTFSTDRIGQLNRSALLAARFGARKFLVLFTRAIKIEALIRNQSVISGVYDVVSAMDAGVCSNVTVFDDQHAYTFQEPRIVDQASERPVRTVKTPDQWVRQIENAIVIPSFQVTKGRKLVIYEPAADPRNGFVAGIQNNIAHIRGQENKAVVVASLDQTLHCNEAILICGRCSPNYFHVFIEYFSKVILVDQIHHLKTVPIIVDAKLFPQELAILDILSPDRTHIIIDNRTATRVRKLYVVSTPTYLTDNFLQRPWENSAIYTSTIVGMRDRIVEKLEHESANGRSGKLIYLARRSGRTVINGVELEEMLSSLGFDIIYPEDLSFVEQFWLFRNADLIVGPLGAAFTNVIFCRPGTKIIALSSPLLTDFCLQSNLAKLSECDYIIFSGSHHLVTEPTDVQRRDIDLVMDNFSIDVEKLKIYLQRELYLLESEG